MRKENRTRGPQILGPVSWPLHHTCLPVSEATPTFLCLYHLSTLWTHMYSPIFSILSFFNLKHLYSTNFFVFFFSLILSITLSAPLRTVNPLIFINIRLHVSYSTLLTPFPFFLACDHFIRCCTLPAVGLPSWIRRPHRPAKSCPHWCHTEVMW